MELNPVVCKDVTAGEAIISGFCIGGLTGIGIAVWAGVFGMKAVVVGAVGAAVGMGSVTACVVGQVIEPLLRAKASE